MRVVRHLDGQSFLQAARSWLLRAEAKNNLILGNAPGIGASPPAGTAPYLACVYDNSEIVGCAMRTPPHKLVITQMPLSAVTTLVDDVAAFYRTLPGVAGPDASAAAFADVWSTRSGERTIRAGRQRIYQIERVTRPSRVASGALRLARESDAALLAGWIAAFAAEATPDERVDAAEAARHRIAHAMLFLWEIPSPSRWRHGPARRRTVCASISCTRRRRCGAAATRQRASEPLRGGSWSRATVSVFCLLTWRIRPTAFTSSSGTAPSPTPPVTPL